MSATLFDEELKNKIRTLYLNGNNYKQIMDILSINDNTWYSAYWKNQQGFRDHINNIEKELLIRQARANLKEVINMDIPLDDPRWLKIKTDVSQFIAETLDKDNFSKKQEQGEQQPVTINIQSNKTAITSPIVDTPMLDIVKKESDNNVAQYTLSQQLTGNNTTPANNDDVKTSQEEESVL
jgi:hypothetical protein